MAPRAAAHRYGLLAAVLFSLSFMQLRYAQEARAYTQYVLALAMSLASAAYILRARLKGRMPSMVPFACLGVSMALVPWSHYTGLLYVLVLGTLAAVWWLTVERGSRQLLGRLCFSGLLCLVLAAQPVWAMMHAHPLELAGWITPPDRQVLAYLVTQEFAANFGTNLGRPELAARVIVFGAWPILGLFVLLRSKNTNVRATGLLMLTMSVGMVTLIAAVTYLGRPIFLSRTLIPAQLGWIMLCAMAPLAIPTRWRAAVTTVLVLCFVLGASAYFLADDRSTTNEDWRGMAAELRARTPGRLNVFTDSDSSVLAKHYLQRGESGADVQVTALPQEISVEIARDQLRSEISAEPWFGNPVETSLDTIVAELSRDQSAWFVVRVPSDELVALLAKNQIVPLVRNKRPVVFHRCITPCDKR
jgi:hypothetical protein